MSGEHAQVNSDQRREEKWRPPKPQGCAQVESSDDRQQQGDDDRTSPGQRQHCCAQKGGCGKERATPAGQVACACLTAAQGVAGYQVVQPQHAHQQPPLRAYDEVAVG